MDNRLNRGKSDPTSMLQFWRVFQKTAISWGGEFINDGVWCLIQHKLVRVCNACSQG